MLLSIVITIGITCLIAKKYFNDKKYADFYSIKGPRSLPLFGNALLFVKSPKDTYELQLKLAKEYNGFYRLLMGSVKVLVIGNPDHIEIILRSMTHIKKSASYALLSRFLGNGLINSDGTYWRKHRKIITPTFHFKSLRNYSTYICKNLTVLIDNLSKQTSKVVKIDHYIKLFALDSISESAMRYSINAQLNTHSDYVKALKGCLSIHMKRFFSIFLRIPIIFKLSMLEKAQDSYIKYIKSITESVIETRKEERQRNTDQSSNIDSEYGMKLHRSFLDNLLDQQEDDSFFTDEEIREEVNTFMFAGHDTVSSSISFCLFELSAHPEVQQRLVEESWDAMGNHKDVEVNLANISSLKYLDAVVKECMRIHTTVPFIERELTEDTFINGKLIPKGTTIQISIHWVHHNEKYYPEPENFDPERFSVENSTERHPYAYIPFSAGPRNCIGFRYGMLITKAAVINILRNFIIKRPTDDSLKPQLYNNAILESANGINIILESRSVSSPSIVN